MLLIAGLLLVALGVLFIASPGSALVTTGMLFGIMLLAAGLSTIAYAIMSSGSEGWGWRLVEGLIDTLFGVILLVNLGATALAIPIVISFWAMFRGVMLVVDSFSYKKMGMSDWWGFLLLGILAAVFGVLMLTNLGPTAIATGWMIGIMLLAIGISAVYYSIKLSKVTVDTPSKWAKKMAEAYRKAREKVEDELDS